MGLDMYLTRGKNLDQQEVGYWRKANAIHKWFVVNVQKGRDECQRSKVSYKKLMTLKELCTTVLQTKNAALLPPQAGFFFGSTEIDEYYFEELKQTLDILQKIEPNVDYYYQASW
jgi:hypothetical protein